MILDISDKTFRDIMGDKRFNLPVQPCGENFEDSLRDLFEKYCNRLYEKLCLDNAYNGYCEYCKKISWICTKLLECIERYHNGLPIMAFEIFSDVICILTGISIYSSVNDFIQIPNCMIKSNLESALFRVRNIDEHYTCYARNDIFHVPACNRSKISTHRYSIVGHPSLYLSTSLCLCAAETGVDKNKLIAARFEFRKYAFPHYVRIIDLSVKPQDFIQNKKNNVESNADFSAKEYCRIDSYSNIYIAKYHTEYRKLKTAYLEWYPLIAACSFIRADKDAKFSSEYIIPQLLMQWLRIFDSCADDFLTGIKYFSCASVHAAQMGFNYVFPVHNTNYKNNYCTVLRDVFWLTPPVYIKDYDSILKCEKALKQCNDIQQIT